MVRAFIIFQDPTIIVIKFKRYRREFSMDVDEHESGKTTEIRPPSFLHPKQATSRCFVYTVYFSLC